MTMSSIGFDCACESSDEHREPEQLDASADAFGAVVRVAGLAVRDGLARPLLLTRNTGTTHGVHTRRAHIFSAFIPNADDACRTAIEAGMKQLPGVSDGTGAHERIAG